MNPFLYTDNNKRYHTLAYHSKVMGQQTWKAAIDLGLSCPNIDGTKGWGGCTFCDGGSHCFAPSKQLSVTEQLAIEATRIHKKRPGMPLTAYFQAHSNTYAPLTVLTPLFEEAVRFSGVVALSIATRPDCLPRDICTYLGALAKRIPLTVELGLQTVHDKTAQKMNRCYSFVQFTKAFARLRAEGVRICVHLLNGLPGETFSEMQESALLLGQLQPDAVKIHLLHVLQGTALANSYLTGEYAPLTLDAYVETVVSQLEYLPAITVVERLTGDGDKARLLAPAWSRDKIRVLGRIDQCLVKQNTWQGRLLLAE